MSDWAAAFGGEPKKEGFGFGDEEGDGFDEFEEAKDTSEIPDWAVNAWGASIKEETKEDQKVTELE